MHSFWDYASTWDPTARCLNQHYWRKRIDFGQTWGQAVAGTLHDTIYYGLQYQKGANLENKIKWPNIPHSHQTSLSLMYIFNTQKNSLIENEFDEELGSYLIVC